MSVDMYQHEFRAEFERLKNEARAALARDHVDQIVALATSKSIAGFGAAEAKQALHEIANAGRFVESVE